MAGLTIKDDKSKDGLVCFSPSTVTTIPTHNEKQATIMNMGNSWEVKVGEILKCNKCTMTFDEKDDLLHHLSASHNGTANSCNPSSSICNEMTTKEGKYECQFCREIFHEESGYNCHVEIHSKTSCENAETSLLKSDPTHLGGLISDSIAKTANDQNDDRISSGHTHNKPKADAIKETHIDKFNNCFFRMEQNFEVTKNDGTFVEESVDEQDKDCNMKNDTLGKVYEASDMLAGKSSLAEAALSTNKDRSIQKTSNESNVLKCSTDGNNELCGSEERISDSHSVAPSGNQRTCEAEDNANGTFTSLKKEIRQERSCQSGLATPNDKEQNSDEIAKNRLFTSTITEVKIDCKDKFGQHEPIIDFENCALHGKDIAINVEQQRVSEDCHLPIPFLAEQKCGFVNNVRGVLAPLAMESKQKRCSGSGLLTLSGNKQTYDVNNNGSWLSTGTGVEMDNSGNIGLTFGFGSNHPQPSEDAVTHVEWGISSGSCSLVSSWKDQTCFKNNTNWDSAPTMEEPLREKVSESGALTPSSKEQIWGVENNWNKFSTGTMGNPKFGEISNSRNRELIIISGNMDNTGVDMDVETSIQKQRCSEGYLSVLSKNEPKFGAESTVNGFCNSAVAGLKMGGRSESAFFISSDDEQKCGLGSDLKRVYPGRFWEVPRLGEENPSNTELMIGFGRSHAQPGQEVMPEVMWRTDEENTLQSALGDSSSSMMLSSGCFPTYDVISDKVQN